MMTRITIDGLLSEYAAATADARELVTSVSPVEFNWKADAKTWSMGECFEHLIITNGKYHRRLQRVTSEAGLPEGPDGWKPGWIGGAFLRRMEPPPRRGYPAPAVFRPETSTFDPTETLARFEETQRNLQELIASLRGKDLGKLKVSSPVSKFLKFSVAAAFAIVVSHERRHLWQARQAAKRSSAEL